MALDARLIAGQRQLARHIFYFARQEDGDFAPTGRFKLEEAELIEPEVGPGGESIKEILVYLTALGDRFVQGVRESSLPSADELAHLEGIYEAEAEHWTTTAVGTRFLNSLEAVQQAAAGPLDDDTASWLATTLIPAYDAAKTAIHRWKKRRAGSHRNKALILERIATERRRLEANLARVPPEMWALPGVVGAWSIKDILAHLFAWEQLLLGWHAAGLRGEKPVLPAPGLTWSEIDTLNATIYRQYRDRPLPEIQAESNRSYREILAFVESLPEADLFAPGLYEWLERANLAGYILANSANHYRWAKNQIRRWLATPNS